MSNRACSIRENASEVLEEYLRGVGGEEKIIQEAKTAIKTKKRGRPSSTAPTNGSKKRRNDSHPASATPPISARAWKPPVGSWEEEIESIDACHDEHTGKLTVYLTWKNGHKTQHDTKVIYQRCPQKVSRERPTCSSFGRCRVLTAFQFYLDAAIL